MLEASGVAATAAALEGASVDPLPTATTPGAGATAALEGTEDGAKSEDTVDKKTPAVEASAKIVATKHAVTKQAATGEAAIEAAEDVTVSAGGGGAS